MVRLQLKLYSDRYSVWSVEPYKMGIPASYGACGWTMRADTRPQGYILAPSYPAVYSDDIDCYYKLEGIPGQRIKLEFLDFDLYYGGDQ